MPFGKGKVAPSLRGQKKNSSCIIFTTYPSPGMTPNGVFGMGKAAVSKEIQVDGLLTGFLEKQET